MFQNRFDGAVYRRMDSGIERPRLDVDAPRGQVSGVTDAAQGKGLPRTSAPVRAA
jgi:hypothetical protein